MVVVEDRAIEFLDAIGLLAYVTVIVWVGVRTRRNRSFVDFAVGRHRLPRLMVFSSLAATVIGPGFSVGFVANGYRSGYLFWILASAYAMQLVVSGCLLAPRLARHRDCLS